MSTEEMSMQELESQFSEQEGLRREKLAELQKAGKDPFDVYKVDRTHTTGEVKSNYADLEGKEVTGKDLSKDIDFLLNMYCRGSVDMTVDWVLNDMPIKKEEIVQYLMDAIPDKLEAYMI